MPANAVAIIMKALAGAELFCRAHNYRFNVNGQTVDRGVISYYASQALPRSVRVQDWLEIINTLSESDVGNGQLKELYRPLLEISGDSTTKLAGTYTTMKPDK
jgi:hypothetical protein